LSLRSRPEPRAVWARVLQRLGLTRTQVGRMLSRWRLGWLRGALRDGLSSWAEVFPQDRQPRIEELVDWSKTSAYSVGYIGQLYVNLVGRDPQGVVLPGQDYEDLRSCLVTRLQEMVDPEDGCRVVDEVLRKEEVYSGRFVPNAPDLFPVMRGLSYITRQGYEYAGEDKVFVSPQPTKPEDTGRRGYCWQRVLMSRLAGGLPMHASRIWPRRSCTCWAARSPGTWTGGCCWSSCAQT
jgi:hypothetical protein